MSEPPVTEGLTDKKSLLPRVHTHPKNSLMQKVEILQAFTEDAINVLRQDLEATKQEATSSSKTDSTNISDLLRALDETHQLFRSKLLRNMQGKRQISESDSRQDFLTDALDSPNRPEEVKKFLFKLDDLSGSKASLEQKEDAGIPDKPSFRPDPPASPLPDLAHPHELEIIEEQNEVDNTSESELPIETETLQKLDDTKV
jgi:hypothetical protein